MFIEIFNFRFLFATRGMEGPSWFMRVDQLAAGGISTVSIM